LTQQVAVQKTHSWKIFLFNRLLAQGKLYQRAALCFEHSKVHFSRTRDSEWKHTAGPSLVIRFSIQPVGCKWGSGTDIQGILLFFLKPYCWNHPEKLNSRFVMCMTDKLSRFEYGWNLRLFWFPSLFAFARQWKHSNCSIGHGAPSGTQWDLQTVRQDFGCLGNLVSSPQ
jgi:hypothetical protein